MNSFRSKLKKRITNKKNLLVLAFVLSLLSVGTVYGRYAIKASAVDDARVAKFNVEIVLQDSQPEEMNRTISFNGEGEQKQLSFLITNHEEVAVKGIVKGVQIDSNTSELPVYTIDSDESFILQPGSSTVTTVTLHSGKTNVFFDTIQNLDLIIQLEQMD